jgi:hypothetical protein
MKKYMSLTALVLLLVFALGVSNCIMETKVMEVVLTDNTCMPFSTESEDEVFTDVEFVDYAAEIDSILVANELSREDLIAAHLVSATYTVTDFEQSTDWTISGAISVERNDIVHGPETLIVYTEQSVPDGVGAVIPAHLHPAGVAVIDSALYDYINNGRNPVFVFRILNGDVDPNPSPEGTSPGPIRFSWEGCIEIHVITRYEGDFPDVF